jgi:hypothetical protein
MYEGFDIDKFDVIYVYIYNYLCIYILLLLTYRCMCDVQKRDCLTHSLLVHIVAIMGE